MTVNQNPQPLGLNSPTMPYVRGVNATAVGNFLCKTGASTFVGVVINTKIAAGVLKVYDGIDATGLLLCTIDLSGATIDLHYGIGCAVGVFAVMSGGNADVTILYT